MRYISEVFKDLLFLQGQRYRTQKTFFGWEQILAVLDQARDGDGNLLNEFEKRRTKGFFDNDYKLDPILINLDKFEIYKYIFLKWGIVFNAAMTEEEVVTRLEYFNDLEKLLEHEGKSESERGQAKGELIERLGDVYRAIKALAGPTLYRDMKEELEKVRKRIAEIEEQKSKNEKNSSQLKISQRNSKRKTKLRNFLKNQNLRKLKNLSRNSPKKRTN